MNNSRSSKNVYLNRQMAVLLLLGFSSGLPLRLTASTFQAWGFDLGIPLATLGAFNFIRVPYSLKFLWAPFLDRYKLPFFGHRKGWIVATQILLVILIISASFITPGYSLKAAITIAFLIAFCSASQDVVIDAYRTESLKPSLYGAGAGVGIFGYRMGMLFSGAVALSLADFLSWEKVYLIMALGMVIGLIGSAFVKESDEVITKPKSLQDAIVLPLQDFVTRISAFEILTFIILFKFGDVVAGSITTPFYRELGFSKSEIGWIDKWVGMMAVIIGGIIGGKFLATAGLLRSLTIFSILQMIGTGLFGLLAISGKNYFMLVISIVGENLFAGMGTAAQVAFLMHICNKTYTATQYALLSSIAALSGIVAGSYSGKIATYTGWPFFFVICSLLGIPGLILLKSRFRKWEIKEF